MKLFLCYRGDGPYWENTILIPGYPDGHSYFRPFRYRDNWIQKDMLNSIQDSSKRTKLTGTQAILGIRFMSELNKWTILPVRRVVISSIDPLSNNQSVYFSMAYSYDFTVVNDLSDVCIEINQAEQIKIGDSLFFQLNQEPVLNECVNQAKEDESWMSFVDLLAADNKLPFKDESKKALFIRYHPLGQKEIPKTDCIFNSQTRGKIYGSKLSEGSSYNLIFFHRVPYALGQSISLKKSLITYKTSTGNLELSSSQEDLTGNYQKHDIEVSARRSSGTLEELVIELPTTLELQDGRLVYTANSHVPVKVSISYWYRFRKTIIWVLIVWISLSANVVWNQILAGQTNWFLILLSVLIALSSAVGVFMLEKK